jgi:hypothetical protein
MLQFLMRQGFNADAVKYLASCWKRPSILVPDMEVASLNDLNYRNLETMHVRYLVFDKDNTLRCSHNQYSH